jgi:hypothetical protein
MYYKIKNHYQNRFQPYLHTIDEHMPGILPRFSKPLGFDFIITPENSVILIELQHGFGRQGLLELFPKASKIYRSMVKNFLREFGRNLYLTYELRKICKDKIKTYKIFHMYQPSSIVYRFYDDGILGWLRGVNSDYILAKPPRQNCGNGILVFKRAELLEKKASIPIDRTYLLQEYIKSKSLPDNDGNSHVGCIRHIVIFHSEGERLSLIHLPSYWRVSPYSFGNNPEREAFTANISRGAYPLKLNDSDLYLIQKKTEEIGLTLISHILRLTDLKIGESKTIGT